ncbi:MAG: glycerol-3-phosphate 1-O-acyltransferase PlsY [Acidobacteria bacterium]|nr:glycerol-3-phosphate 1-O-acyltransferase PlsY [Acidobacteriota bacterium]
MILSACTGYAIGSLPLGYLAGRRWGGVDLRAVGSRNVGATNMYRVSGPRLGVAVMILDMAKGALAVALTSAAVEGADPVAAGVAAVAGHVYPIWLRGHGGKGVATACGAFALLAPVATLVAALAFALTVALTRVVSAGSLIASVALPVATAMTGAATAVVWGSALAGLLIVWRHRGNLARLRRGTEHRLARRGMPHA